MNTEINLDKTMRNAFLLYGEEVAINRSVPDVRDGLKLGLRQGLYAQFSEGLTHSGDMKKALKSVAAATSQSYVHGDAAMYSTFIRTAKPWVYRYPIEDAQGAYGSPCAPDDESASRYVEMRGAAITDYFFDGIKKNAVEHWYPNYDDTEMIPSVFPAFGFWNVVNGATGIAVGFGTSIPSFNLTEVNNTLIKLMDNPDAPDEEIICYPDFATACDLINKDEVYKSLLTGRGAAAKLRAKLEYVKTGNYIKATNLPQGVFTNTVMKELADLTKEEDYGVLKAVDHTKKEAEIWIYLMPKTDPQRMIRKLYKDTSLQYHYGINMVMLDEGRYPKVFSWREACLAHIKHIRIGKRRELEFDRDKLLVRKEKLEGLLIAVANVDDVIDIIKNAEDDADSCKKLMDKYALSQAQAESIIDMKLKTLTKTEAVKVKKSLDEVNAKLDSLNKTLSDPKEIDKLLIEIIKGVTAKFGDKRRTELMNLEIIDDKEEKELATVIPENVVVTLTRSGEIKRIASAAFKVQNKGGKGIKSASDELIGTIATNTIDTLMLFSDKGKMYRILVDKVPEGTVATKGVHLSNFLEFEPNEKIIAITSLHRKTTAKYIIFCTKLGMIKKSEIGEYTKVKRNSGIAAIKLADGDSIVSVTFLEDEDMMFVSKNGKCIMFPTYNISPIGRVGMGVKAMKLDEGDSVIAALPIHNKSDYIAVFTKSGLGRKTPLSDFSIQARGGKGVNLYKSADEIVGVHMVSDEDNVIIFTRTNAICISTKDISSSGKSTIGTTVVKVPPITGTVKI